MDEQQIKKTCEVFTHLANTGWFIVDVLDDDQFTGFEKSKMIHSEPALVAADWWGRLDFSEKVAICRMGCIDRFSSHDLEFEFREMRPHTQKEIEVTFTRLVNSFHKAIADYSELRESIVWAEVWAHFGRIQQIVFILVTLGMLNAEELDPTLRGAA